MLELITITNEEMMTITAGSIYDYNPVDHFLACLGGAVSGAAGAAVAVAVPAAMTGPIAPIPVVTATVGGWVAGAVVGSAAYLYTTLTK